LLLETTTVKAKALSFVLSFENRLVASFWTFFKYLDNHSELEKPKLLKPFVDAGISF